MQDKVYKAVEIIKGYCAKVVRCEKCRFSNAEGGCLFAAEIAPCDWDLDKWKYVEETE